jgi:thiamine biosynthesis protein ThiI
LGQVSSQTLRNLRALEGRLDLPILRPLVGLDKEEIIARSRDIGTYEISATVQEYCDIVPDKPATAASVWNVAADEQRVEIDFEKLLHGRVVLEARKLDPNALAVADLEIDTIPVDAVVLDVRSITAFRAWHWPGALHMEIAEALRLVDRMERDKTYVAVCEIGLKSAHLAYRMRQAGLNAYNYRGGLKALLRTAKGAKPLEFLDESTTLPPTAE